MEDPNTLLQPPIIIKQISDYYAARASEAVIDRLKHCELYIKYVDEATRISNIPLLHNWVKSIALKVFNFLMNQPLQHLVTKDAIKYKQPVRDLAEKFRVIEYEIIRELHAIPTLKTYTSGFYYIFSGEFIWNEHCFVVHFDASGQNKTLEDPDNPSKSKLLDVVYEKFSKFPFGLESMKVLDRDTRSRKEEYFYKLKKSGYKFTAQEMLSAHIVLYINKRLRYSEIDTFLRDDEKELFWKCMTEHLTTENPTLDRLLIREKIESLLLGINEIRVIKRSHLPATIITDERCYGAFAKREDHVNYRFTIENGIPYRYGNVIGSCGDVYSEDGGKMKIHFTELLD